MRGALLGTTDIHNRLHVGKALNSGGRRYSWMYESRAILVPHNAHYIQSNTPAAASVTELCLQVQSQGNLELPAFLTCKHSYETMPTSPVAGKSGISNTFEVP